MTISQQNNVLPFVAIDTRPKRDPEPVRFETLPVITIENIAEFFLGGPTNRELALEAAEEFAQSRGWK